MNDIYIYIYICAYVLYTGTCCITDCISIQYIYISTYTHICNVHSILHTHTPMRSVIRRVPSSEFDKGSLA